MLISILIAVVAGGLYAYDVISHKKNYDTTKFAAGNGRLEATEINVAAKLAGRIDGILVEEGDLVKKGQKLFQIQPDEYRLAVQDASARVSENAAVYSNSVTEYKRAAMLIKDDMISREAYDNSVAIRNSKKASLDAAKAQYAKARLNLSYTTIYAPMSGRIGKLNISKGNYVTQLSGTLATIYTVSPIRVTFDLKSSDYIHVKKLFNTEGPIDNFDVVDVQLKLSDGSIYNNIGKIKFTNNRIDETTGTVKMRALFDNPNELLMPGDYVNVILTVKVPHEVMLIPQSATKTDVGTGYYVWIDNKCQKITENISA